MWKRGSQFTEYWIDRIDLTYLFCVGKSASVKTAPPKLGSANRPRAATAHSRAKISSSEKRPVKGSITKVVCILANSINSPKWDWSPGKIGLVSSPLKTYIPSPFYYLYIWDKTNTLSVRYFIFVVCRPTVYTVECLFYLLMI